MFTLPNCTMCHHMYEPILRTPRELHCQHIYCHRCIIRLAQSSEPSNRVRITCPLCFRVTILSSLSGCGTLRADKRLLRAAGFPSAEDLEEEKRKKEEEEEERLRQKAPNASVTAMKSDSFKQSWKNAWQKITSYRPGWVNSWTQFFTDTTWVPLGIPYGNYPFHDRTYNSYEYCCNRACPCHL